jgi:hypothetical protein
MWPRGWYDYVCIVINVVGESQRRLQIICFNYEQLQFADRLSTVIRSDGA